MRHLDVQATLALRYHHTALLAKSGQGVQEAMAMRNTFAALSLDESEESAQSEGSRKSKAAKKKSKAATSESTVAEESAAVAAERDGCVCSENQDSHL